MADSTQAPPSEFPTGVSLQREQADALSKLGEVLRQHREHKGLSVEEIAGKTLINPRHLRSIEAGRLDLLPESVYVQGFIRRFADAVCLDGSKLASGFPTAPATGAVGPSQAQLTSLPPRLPRLPQSLRLNPSVLYVFLGLGGLSVLTYLSWPTLSQSAFWSRPANHSISPDPGIQRLAASASASPVRLAPVQPLLGQTPASLSRSAVKLTVRAEGQSWLRVIADGKTQFQGLVSAGEVKNWSAQEKIVIRAGNGAGVLASVNDRPAQRLGKPGEVVDVVASANGVEPRHK